MELETITYDVRDNVAHVHLNRPEGANAVSEAFAADFKAVMMEIEWDADVRAASVTAEGKVFCAGGDLKEFHSQGADLPRHGAKLLADFHAAIYKMNRMPKPFIAESTEALRLRLYKRRVMRPISRILNSGRLGGS